MKINPHVKLLLLPLSLFGTAVLTLVPLYVLELLFRRTSIWLSPVEYLIICSTIVYAGWLFSPYWNRSISLLVAGIGVNVAWQFLHDAYFPENHPRAYQHTLIPFFCAVTGLGLGFILALLTEKKIRKTQH